MNSGCPNDFVCMAKVIQPVYTSQPSLRESTLQCPELENKQPLTLLLLG